MVEKEYIEREALIRYAEKQEVIIKDGTSVADAMRIQGNVFRRCVETCPTADVAPKSEVDKLEYILTGVMHSVDKWLDGEELKQDEVNRAITMREKTLRIIEDAKSEIERLEKDNKKLTINMNAFGLTAIRQKEEKDALAREIFEEIDEAMIDHARGDTTDHWLFVRIAELKKKYTEGTKNE